MPLSLCLIMALVFALKPPAVHAIDFARLRATLVLRFGPDRLPVLEQWQKTLSEINGLEDLAKLHRINTFINDNTRFLDDEQVWQQKDYWATPLQLIGRGQGDCEDLAIAKYYSLKNAGIEIAKLRLVYVRAQINQSGKLQTQAHMILAYYSSPLSEPLVLDNLVADIRPASQRNDLQPVFSFNHEALWSGVANDGPSSNGKQLTRWEDLQMRAAEEGMD